MFLEGREVIWWVENENSKFAKCGGWLGLARRGGVALLEEEVEVFKARGKGS